MNINLDWYQTFYYAAKYESISLAAEKLCISQPAVSQIIKQLERSLDCLLFIRSSKGVHLTVEGSTLFYYVENGYEHIKLGEKKLVELLNLESGELRIGASDMTLQYYLLPYLEKFHKLYPSIKINVTNGPTPETIKLLRQDKIDFGIVSEPLIDQKGFTSYPVRAIFDVFICSVNRSELTQCRHSLDQLKTLPLICLEKNTSSRRYIDTFFAKHGISLNPEFELATSNLIVEFVKKNLGIGCVVRDFAIESIARGEICELMLTDAIPSRNMRIIKSNSAPLSKAGLILLDMLA